MQDEPKVYEFALDAYGLNVLLSFADDGRRYMDGRFDSGTMDKKTYDEWCELHRRLRKTIIEKQKWLRIYGFTLTEWEKSDLLGLMDMGAKHADYRLEIGTMDTEKRDRWARANKRLRKKILKNWANRP